MLQGTSSIQLPLCYPTRLLNSEFSAAVLAVASVGAFQNRDLTVYCHARLYHLKLWIVTYLKRLRTDRIVSLWKRTLEKLE